MPISHICEGKGPKIQVLSTQAHACDGYLLNTQGSGAKCFALAAWLWSFPKSSWPEWLLAHLPLQKVQNRVIVGVRVGISDREASGEMDEIQRRGVVHPNAQIVLETHSSSFRGNQCSGFRIQQFRTNFWNMKAILCSLVLPEFTTCVVLTLETGFLGIYNTVT